MNAIILAAGAGQRFRDAGYAIPKPLLPMPDGRPLIAWVRERVPVAQATVVVRAQDGAAIRPWLRPNDEIIVQSTPPCGQLDSAVLALDGLQGETLLVYCDVLFDAAEFVRQARSSGAQTGVVTFTSADPRYGYWNGAGVTEKRVVSNEAVFGVFYLDDAAWAAELARTLPPTATVPDLLDSTTWRMPVGARPPDLGTPADYEQFCAGVQI